MRISLSILLISSFFMGASACHSADLDPAAIHR